ncbi:phage portal protein [Ottowia sp. GY511]|uniref:Phage portal protein n=1 Tax=Ottowia flava TaxID=2675430 RepID=A0ABW4KNZ8_9BURK|nr:phage portal protein [Ottowia sp. GY511]TXK26377.1 phage portal protein [Ottowia sp. GY511]
MPSATSHTAARPRGLGQRIRAAVAGWMGQSVSLSDAEGMAALFARREVAGVEVSGRTILSLSTVWACARLISETIATLPLSMYERTPTGRRVASGHRLHMVLHDQPSVDSTAAVFWESVVAAMLLRGNAHCEKLIVAGRIVGLVFLAPNRLTKFRHPNGVTEWRYFESNGRQRTIPNARIWHVPGFTVDGENGLSVIEHGAIVFGNALAAGKASSDAFGNGLMQPLFYKLGQWLKPEQREEFKKSVAGSIERGETPLLEGGIGVDSIGIKPVDAQLLESRAFSVEELCRWFRVPPWMVGHTEKSTSWGTGIEQQMIGFLTFTLAPWLRRIEQAISKDLLTPAERLRYYPKFAVEGLLRADSNGRATFYGAMVNNGILTRDEVRSLEDREPKGGNAAVLTVQSAMTTLNGIGQTSDAAQASAALRAFIGVSDTPPPQD